MIVLIAAVIIVLILVVWKGSNAIKYKRIRSKLTAERNALIPAYEQWKKEFQSSIDMDSWLSRKMNRTDLCRIDDMRPDYSYDDVLLFKTLMGFAIGFAVIGIIILVFCNIDNRTTYEIASDKTAMYQEFVNNISDDRLAQGGYDEVIDWNKTILANRTYQDDWFFSCHHWTDGDWNEIPLVRFNNESNKE